jgi:hypothetical protein
VRQEFIGDERVASEPPGDALGEQAQVDARAALPRCTQIAIDNGDADVLSRHVGRDNVPSLTRRTEFLRPRRCGGVDTL